MRETQPTVRRRSGTRVLVSVSDRRFRAVASALLEQRGCAVKLHELGRDIREQAASDNVDVVLMDATGSLTTAAETAARLQTLRPQIGLVAVSSDPRDRLRALEVIQKWGPVDALCHAIERARGSRAYV